MIKRKLRTCRLLRHRSHLPVPLRARARSPRHAGDASFQEKQLSSLRDRNQSQQPACGLSGSATEQFRVEMSARPRSFLPRKCGLDSSRFCLGVFLFFCETGGPPGDATSVISVLCKAEPSAAMAEQARVSRNASGGPSQVTAPPSTQLSPHRALCTRHSAPVMFAARILLQRAYPQSISHSCLIVHPAGRAGCFGSAKVHCAASVVRRAALARFRSASSPRASFTPRSLPVPLASPHTSLQPAPERSWGAGPEVLSHGDDGCGRRAREERC